MALVAAVWAGLFSSFLLFQVYRRTGKRPLPRWMKALEVPEGSLPNTYWRLLIVSVLGLFLELLMIRWISSEITIFAYFKNFVLIACFLGFGLGAHLSRQPVNLLSLFAPMAYFALLIKLPWDELRRLIQLLTSLLGSTTEVDVWGVASLPLNTYTLTGLGITLLLVIPLFSLLSLIFIPVGQLTARMLERSADGIKGYSVNIIGSLLGVLLYTGLCLLYQPPSVWFLAAGALMLISIAVNKRLRWAAVATTIFCAGMLSLPASNSSIQDVLVTGMGTGKAHSEWSPYQKLTWAASTYKGETVSYQLTTNDSWFQYVVDLSDDLSGTSIYFTTGAPTAHEVPIVLGQWTHVAIAYDETGLAYYAGGLPQGTFESPTMADENDVLVGADLDMGQIVANFSGAVDDLRIYDRKLAADEIVTLAR